MAGRATIPERSQPKESKKGEEEDFNYEGEEDLEEEIEDETVKPVNSKEKGKNAGQEASHRAGNNVAGNKSTANLFSHPDFTSLKNKKLEKPKENYSEYTKPNMKADVRTTKDEGIPRGTLRPSASKPNFNKPISKPTESGLARRQKDDAEVSYKLNPNLASKPDLYLRSNQQPAKSRLSKMLEAVNKYLYNEERSSLLELFQHNIKGTALFKEINEILSDVIDKQRPRLMAGIEVEKKGKGKESRMKMLDMEFQSGEKLIQNFLTEYERISVTLESVRDPL